MIKGLFKLKSHPSNEEGIVLLVVLLVLSLISVLVLSWGQEWTTELKLVSNFRETNQCRRLAEAGVYYALGKLAAARTKEMAAPGIDFSPQEDSGHPVEIWQGDREVHVLELPEGRVEVRVEDEGGKIYLNRAPEAVLFRLFTALGLPELRVRTMVDSALDWLNRSDRPRRYGAQSDYYLGLDPPYVAKNGPFEVVEELAWVRGFETGPLIPRMAEWLTVQSTGNAVNINTAPLEVLQAMGFSPDIANIIIASRKTRSIKDVAEISRLISNPVIGQELGISFKPSPFVTIRSQGKKKTGGQYTIKTIVRLNVNKPAPWKILSWLDDFPG
jgi:general secretion pathway protein K